MRSRGVLLALALLGGRAGADPPPPGATPAPAPATAEQAADAVVVAWIAKDAAALKALASKDNPDPWFVADELLARGEQGAADGFATAAPRLDVEMLPAYVASRRGVADDPARRKRLATVNAALADRKPQEALAALGSPEPATSRDVVAIRLASARGHALFGVVRLEAAAETFLAVAEAAERMGWLVQALRAYHQAGLAAYRGSVYPAALAAWTRRLAVCERRSDRVGAALTLVNIGNVHYGEGDFATALSTFERALAANEALGNHAGAATALGNIGHVHHSLGDFAKALAAYERALAAKEALGDRVGAAQTLGGIGNVHFGLGDFAKALAISGRALATFEALGDREGEAATLVSLGNVHASLGDFARALSMYERALAAQEALGDRAGAALTLGNMGNVHQALGDFANALSTYERARTAQEALGNRAGAAATLGNIGTVHHRRGDFEQALPIYERAIAAKEAVGDRAGAAATLNNVGHAHLSLGDVATALSTFESARAAAVLLGSKQTSLVATVGIAATRLERGEAREAAAEARRAVVEVGHVASGLAEEQGAGARAGFASAYAIGARAAAARSDAVDVSYFLESGKAGALLESLKGRGAMRRVALPDALRAAEDDAHAGETAAVAAYRRVLGGGDLPTVRARRKDMEAAQERVRDVVERIQRQAKKAANVLYFAADPLEVIRKRMGAGEALVGYGLFEKESLALVVTAADARIVRLPEEEEIEAACTALAVTDPESASAAGIEALRTLVVEPLALGKDVKRVLVSPDGALAYVPFSALIADREVVYEPSGTTYGLLLEDAALRGEGVLALGDPDYAAAREPRAEESSSRAGGFRLAALPASREEARAVGDSILLGKDATEAGFAAGVLKRTRWRAIHLACHGLVDAERPTLSSLALTADAEDDGFLTAIDVFRSRIPADLVVLSACETAKGKIVKGEGIVGLTRAFMFAGAPRVLCSLWKVDDEATRALMVKFYELWNPKDGKRGRSTATALKQAQEFVRSHQKWKHPYYWAAWVLWGIPS